MKYSMSLAVVAITLSSVVSGAFYMKIDDIKGEAMERGTYERCMGNQVYGAWMDTLGHRFGTYLQKHPENIEQVLERITSMLERTDMLPGRRCLLIQLYNRMAQFVVDTDTTLEQFTGLELLRTQLLEKKGHIDATWKVEEGTKRMACTGTTCPGEVCDSNDIDCDNVRDVDQDCDGTDEDCDDMMDDALDADDDCDGVADDCDAMDTVDEDCAGTDEDCAETEDMTDTSTAA